MKKLKDLFRRLQTDSKCVLFTVETINKKELKNLKKSLYVKDKEFFNLFSILENKNDFLNNEKKVSVPIKATFVEKQDDIDRSILFNFDGPFQLLHADVTNLEFLGNTAANPKYCFAIVDLFSSKT